MFYPGERVFHSKRKEKGLFHRYDEKNPNVADVGFLENKHYVTHNVPVECLEKIEDHNVILVTAKGYISRVGFIGGRDIPISVRYIDNINYAQQFKASFFEEFPDCLQRIEEIAKEKIQKVPVQIVPQTDEELIFKS